MTKGPNVPKVVRLGESDEGELFVELSFRGVRGQESYVLRASDIGDHSAPLFDWLANAGCIVVGRERGNIAREVGRQIATEIASGKPIGRVVTGRGWSAESFVTAYKVHSAGETPMVAGELSFADDSHLADVTCKRLRAFYRYVGTGNPLVKFCIMMSFAPALLKLLDTPHQPWFVLVGDTSRGKSSILRLAASVWGGELRGLLGNVRSLSATANGLEDACAEAQDIIFPLDDVQAITSKERATLIRDLVHRTSGGVSRARRGEKTRTWRNIPVTASNSPMAEIFSEGNVPFDEPLQVRLVELPCYEEYGVFSQVPSGMSPADFATKVADLAKRMRGAAGEHFVARLVKEASEDKGALVRELKGYIREFKDELPEYESDPAANRILDMFGIVYAAGRLVREYGIVGWNRDVLTDAVVRTFKQSRRFVTGKILHTNAAYVLSRYLEENAPHIFTIRHRAARKAIVPTNTVAIEHELAGGSWEYCMTLKQLQQALGGLQKVQEGLKQLKKQGVLLVEANGGGHKLTCKRQIGSDRLRLYCFDVAQLRAVSAQAAQVGQRARATAARATEKTRAVHDRSPDDRAERSREDRAPRESTCHLHVVA